MWWHSIVCSLGLLHVFFLFASSGVFISGTFIGGVLLGYNLWWCIYCELLFIDECHLFIGGVLWLDVFIVDDLLSLMAVGVLIVIILWHVAFDLKWIFLIDFVSWLMILNLYYWLGKWCWYWIECPFNFDYLFFISSLYTLEIDLASRLLA